MHPREGGKKIFGRPVSRRDFLRRSAAAAAGIPMASGLLAACGPNPKSDAASEAPLVHPARKNNPVDYSKYADPSKLIQPGLKNEGGPLEIFNWEGYINPRIVGMFEYQFGVKVNITTFATMVDAITRLTTRAQTYDIFMGLTKDFVGRCIILGLLRPLQHSYVPNLANVWDSLSGVGADKNAPFYDVGSNFTVPYTTYTTGLGYRIDKGPTDHIAVNLAPLEEQVPAMDNPYDLLWDPKYKGYSHMLDDYREALGMAMLRRGRFDVNTDDPKTRDQYINDARDDLVEAMRSVGTKFDVNDYVDLPEGRAYVHQSWSGDLPSIQYYYPSWSQRDMIRYWYPPDHKGVIGGDTIAILADGKNPVLSHTFMNYMLDFENSMINFKWMGYAPPLKKVNSPTMLVKGAPDAIPEYAVVPPGLANCVPSEDDFKIGVQLLELPSEADKLWKDAWEVVQTTT